MRNSKQGENWREINLKKKKQKPLLSKITEKTSQFIQAILLDYRIRLKLGLQEWPNTEEENLNKERETER